MISRSINRSPLAQLMLSAAPNFYPDETPPAETPPAGDTPPAETPPAGDPAPVELPKTDEPTLLAGAEDDKPAPKDDEPKDEPKPGVPEAYTLSAGKDDEGKDVALDPEALEAATPLFKELGLTNEQAQKIVDIYVPQMQKVAQTVQGETLRLLGLDQIGQWAEQTRADKEIGGAALKESLALAAKGRDMFATEGLKTLFEQSRIGNHPEMVRLFARIGKAVSEGTFETSDSNTPEEKFLHQTLYGPEFQPKTS